MVIAPRETEDALLAAADDVAAELGLPACWFNTDVQLLIHALPMGWQDRRVLACASGRLRVDAIGRVDLLAMKVYAGRAQDLQDIRDMEPLLHELRVVASFIDLERLPLETARLAPAMPRLFVTAVTWLQIFGDALARHRLRHLMAEELAPTDHPVLGLLLELGQAGSHPPRFAALLRELHAAPDQRPLFDIARSSAAMAERARRRASPESKRWGRWCEPVEPRSDALAPAHVVMSRNPWLRLAVDFRGDLRASVVASLRHDSDARISESALTRCAGGSRAQVRNALANLELTGRAARIRSPGVRKTRIVVMG